MGDWDWKWAFVLAVLVGGYMYYDKSSKSDLTKTLQKRGLVAKGTVIDGHKTTRRKGGTDYYVKVQFSPQKGGVRKPQLEVSSTFYDRISLNMPVDVLYLEEDPEQCMIKGEELASETETTIALWVLLVGLAGSAWLGFDIWKKKSTA